MSLTRFSKGKFSVEPTLQTGFSFEIQNKNTYEKLLKLPPEYIVEVLHSFVCLKSQEELNQLTSKVDKFYNCNKVK